jgi:hypothetical protein
VDHCADIWLVNPHTKRDRRDHYLDPASEELLLNSLAVLGIEAGVIRPCREVTGKFRRQRVRLLSGRYIDDPGPALLIAEQFAGQCGPL